VTQLPHRELADLRGETAAIAQLARDASIEINVADVPQLPASRAYLPAGKRVYISHLPKQSWNDTLAACRAVRSTGFEPIPHIPVRLLDTASTLDRLLDAGIRTARLAEVLLIAGDYAKPAGPFQMVADVLESGVLSGHGLRRVSLAGHPEGHPVVALADIRRAELEKARLAELAGLKTTFVTQFFFEARPFLDWADITRAAGIGAMIVGGVCGPAGVATLFKFARRCGVGASIRALGARPTAFVKLLGEHGPERLIRELAHARHGATVNFTGVHVFCFGGYLRTCEWLHRVASGQIELAADGSFSANRR
jgi:methylenetetrahydrofolate reductase (NADPH)